MKIYVLIYNDDDGLRSEVILDEDKANAEAHAYVSRLWGDSPHGSMPDDWRDAQDTLNNHGNLDTVQIEEHDLGRVDVWWKLLKHPGSFGCLYDPQELVDGLTDWDDDHEFDPGNAEDLCALTAWCKAEGAGFEDDFAKLVWDNAPTRQAAYDALERARTPPSEPLGSTPPTESA